MPADRRMLILLASFTERWVLSLVFFYLGWVELGKAEAIHSGKAALETSSMFVDVAHHYILFVLGCLTGLFLMVARRPTALPDRLRFVLVPLGTTFFTLLYYTVPAFPEALRVNLCPVEWRSALVKTGFACVILGPFISLWGIVHLGRSFGVFVAVRKVVLTGPYQWVRHPMYLGWVVICLGVALSNFSGAYFLLTALHVALLLYRAHLEETQLAQHSAEYRAYTKRTGFIFPKLWRPADS
jgi:protein-S-isoprenylcysteine O-methyltransferase Ste14